MAEHEVIMKNLIKQNLCMTMMERLLFENDKEIIEVTEVYSVSYCLRNQSNIVYKF